MPRITGIRERGRKVRVEVDGEYWAELDQEVVAQRNLTECAELSNEDLHELRVAGEYPLAMSRALNLIGYRARSTHEIRQKLSRANYSDASVDLVISRLRELRYLDDEEYARELAQDKSRKYGPRRIYAELRKAGIQESTACRIVDDEFTGRSEADEANEAAARRYNRSDGSAAQAQRVYGFLTRRGYSAEVCAEVARIYRQPSSEETEG
ncbi:RecX family transcriptional regulator [soil metagenome]